MRKSLLLLALVALLTGCGSDDSNQDQTGAETTEDTAPEYAADEATYVKAADNLIASYTRNLKSELMSAINERGPVQAISVCATVAPEVQAAHAAGGWSVRRVSEKFRNPGNRADTTQLRLLQEFADTAAALKYYNWPEPDSTGVQYFRYYQPIYVANLCLKCHGDMQTLAPGVFKALRRHYPTDRATGYRDGDLRGLFVVEAPWPDGLEVAQLLASGQPLPIPDTTVVDSVGGDSTLVDSAAE